MFEIITEFINNPITTSILIPVVVSIIVGYFLYHKLGIERIKIEKLFEKRIEADLKLYEIILKLKSPSSNIRKIQTSNNLSKIRAIFKKITTGETEKEEQERKMYEAMGEDVLNQIKPNFFRTLIKNIYDFYKSEYFPMLSKEVIEYVDTLVEPILDNENIYNDINFYSTEITINRSASSYEEKIDTQKALEILSKIERKLYFELKKDKIEKILK